VTWRQPADGDSVLLAPDQGSDVTKVMIADEGVLAIGDSRLEYRMIGPRPDAAATLVLLHEGLGSVALWGDVPARLAAATGLGVFSYSRAGYGGSSPAAMPRRLTFMQEEAQGVLPLVLDAIGFKRGVLIGHSDGATIAAIYAGSVEDHRVRGLVLLAPHFIAEEFGIAEVARMRAAYETGELRAKLAKWHDSPDDAFYGWSGPWLDPAFRAFDITEELAYIRVPMLIVQGEDDQYGTLRQVEIAKEACQCPVEALILPGVRHVPHRDAADATLRAIVEFIGWLDVT
jgi:pimeloyl-ACP methyl ester carboxylesterase